MQFPSLIHLARIVQAYARGQEVVVLGSSSLLGTFPNLGDEGNLLEPSLDADFLLFGCDEEFAAVLDESVGAESLFQKQTGYHADILRPAITDLLPNGWRERLVPLSDCPGISCLEPHDLAVAKLQAGRPKDLSLLRALFSANMLDKQIVRERLNATRLAESMVVLTFQRLTETL